MEVKSNQFKTNAHSALQDQQLQSALVNLKLRFQKKRLKAMDNFPQFETLRNKAGTLKNHTLDNLAFYLDHFDQQVSKQGGHVHWANDAEEARTAVLNICQAVDAKTVTKGKSMISEEIAINEYLEKNGIESIETDLGEYIIQLRKEPPSHIVAPAFHLNKQQVAETFYQHHNKLTKNRSLTNIKSLVDEARLILRKKFLNADVGITGANFMVAETGSTVIVTNEGNGDLTQTLPKVHIVLASIEKIVPTLEDLSLLLRLLARSATGQEISVYTTFSSGPKQKNDLDGPEQFHVIILDNGRSNLLHSENRDVLRCIRCGACMNHCPVYGSIGGHSYGWVYPGPIGSALDPGLIGMAQTHHLPNASSFCGRCEEVCPVKIPLTKIMRHWRQQEFEDNLLSCLQKNALRSWAWLATHPKLYHSLSRWLIKLMHFFGKKPGFLRKLPAAQEWTSYHVFPTPQKSTFQDLYRAEISPYD